MAASPQQIDGVFSKFLPRFGETEPKVEVRLTEAVGVDLLAMLERGELHLGISSSQALREHEHLFGSFTLPALQFIACCHKGLRLARGRAVEIERLAAHRLLLLDPSFVTLRTIFDAGCRLAGIEPSVGVESRAPHTLLALAEVGYGVAVISSVLPTQRYALNTFRIAQGSSVADAHGNYWDKRRTLPTYAGLFCDAFDRYAREVFPNRIERKVGAKTSGGAARRSGSRRQAWS